MALRRPEEFSHHEVQLDGIRIHYVREGRGPPLVLMHGWPGFWWEWYKCIGALAEEFDVIAPDMRGYGDSEKPDLNDLSKYHLNEVTADHANDRSGSAVNITRSSYPRRAGNRLKSAVPPASRGTLSSERNTAPGCSDW